MYISFNSNSIFLMGDSHSVVSAERWIYFNQAVLFKKDIVHIGDFGLGFRPRKELDILSLNNLNKTLSEISCRLFVIRGNHDDKSWWDNPPEFSNLFLASDYSEGYFPNGKTALLVGGGISIDRCRRFEGVDYWESENTPYQKVNKTFDCLFSHDCPDYFNYSTDSLRISPYKNYLLEDAYLFEDCKNQREVIAKIVKDVGCKYCISGHYHNKINEVQSGIYYRCLSINELDLLNTNNIRDFFRV